MISIGLTGNFTGLSSTNTMQYHRQWYIVHCQMTQNSWHTQEKRPLQQSCPLQSQNQKSLVNPHYCVVQPCMCLMALASLTDSSEEVRQKARKQIFVCFLATQVHDAEKGSVGVDFSKIIKRLPESELQSPP